MTKNSNQGGPALIPKLIGNRKRDCSWGCARGINITWEICSSKSTNQEGVRSAHRTDLCFSNCRFSQVVFIPRAQPHAQSLFLFPIVFGINHDYNVVARAFARSALKLVASLLYLCSALSLPDHSGPVYTYPGHPDIRLRIGLSFTHTRVKCTLSGALRYAIRSDSKTISKVDNPDVSIRFLQV